MRRRGFLASGLSGLLIPALGFAGPARPGSLPVIPTHVFFDPRFRVARNAVLEAPGTLTPIRVSADVTGVWREWLSHSALGENLLLEGYTTESFHFCLRTLLEEQVRVSSRLWRIDRDVHRWVLETRPHRLHGVST